MFVSRAECRSGVGLFSETRVFLSIAFFLVKKLPESAWDRWRDRGKPAQVVQLGLRVVRSDSSQACIRRSDSAPEYPGY